MEIITLANITGRVHERILIELTDNASTKKNIVDEAKLQLIIDDMNAFVSNVLREIYTVPLEAEAGETDAYNDAMLLLKSLALKFVMYQLYSNAGYQRYNPMVEQKKIIPSEYGDAYTELDLIRTGEVNLYGFKKRTSAGFAIAINKVTGDLKYTSDIMEKY